MGSCSGNFPAIVRCQMGLLFSFFVVGRKEAKKEWKRCQMEICRHLSVINEAYKRKKIGEERTHSSFEFCGQGDVDLISQLCCCTFSVNKIYFLAWAWWGKVNKSECIQCILLGDSTSSSQTHTTLRGTYVLSSTLFHSFFALISPGGPKTHLVNARHIWKKSKAALYWTNARCILQTCQSPNEYSGLCTFLLLTLAKKCWRLHW